MACARYAIPLIKALLLRLSPSLPVRPAAVVFAEKSCCIPGRLHRVGHRRLPKGKPVTEIVHAGSCSVTPGEQGVSRRYARILDIEIGEPDSFRADPVDVRCGHSPGSAVRIHFTYA